jgi:hypothetical protein
MKYEREGNLIKLTFNQEEEREPDDPICIIVREWYPEWLIQLKLFYARRRRDFLNFFGIVEKPKPWKKWPKKPKHDHLKLTPPNE